MPLNAGLVAMRKEVFDGKPPSQEAFRAGVVIVNWNGWRDTLECLEAVFRVRGFDGPVVVVDNGSADESVAMIRAWAAGEVCALPQNPQARIRNLVVPPVAKPVACEVATNGLPSGSRKYAPNARLFLICAGENLGFAGGNNLGLKLLLGMPGIDLIWFVNNDALPDEDSYRAILAAVGGLAEPFIAGSAMIEYWEPERVQALGGRFWRYLGLSRHVMEGATISELASLPMRVGVDYPIGASLVVNRAYVERFGGMCEDYFLYFEEIDWALRMGWPSAAVAVPRSLVFHKGGTATAAGRNVADRSLLADYYMLRGRLLLARKISWWTVLTTIAGNVVAIVRRFTRPPRGVVVNAIAATRDGMLGIKGRRVVKLG